MLRRNLVACAAALLLAAAPTVLAQEVLTNAFTYQGQLKIDNLPVEGNYDFAFVLFDASAGGAQVGPVIYQTINVARGGLFTTRLDFGADRFNGDRRWLNIAVRQTGSGGGYVTLSPRQELSGTPYALFALAPWHMGAGGKLYCHESIGIGVTSPATPLHVMGMTTIDSNLAGGVPGALRFSEDGALRWTFLYRPWANDEFWLHNETLGAPALVTRRASNFVGIGESNPLARLHVQQNDIGLTSAMTLDNLLVEATDAQLGLYSARQGGWGSGLSLGEVNAGVLTDKWGLIRQPAPASSLHLTYGTDANPANNSASMTFLPSGLVGIGAYPNCALHVNTTTGAALRVQLNGASRLTVASNGGVSIGALQDTPPASGLYVSGDVGIGTAAPQEALSVQEGMNIDQANLCDGTITSHRALFFGGNAGEAILSKRTAGGNQYGLEFFTNNTHRMTITNAGNVGIGTTTPADRLQITNGNLRFTNTTDAKNWVLAYDAANDYFYIDEFGFTRHVFIKNGGNVGLGRVPTTNRLEVNGSASKSTAGDWLANSDRRIKTDVQPIENALDKLARVQLVSFKYTDEYRKEHKDVADHRYFNVIAQEFAEIFPDFVKGSGDKLPNGQEILQVDPYPLTIYSAAAVQELHKMVKARDAQVTSLQDELTQMRARMQKLEATVAKLPGGKAGGE